MANKSRTKWCADDDRLLLLLIKQKTSMDVIAQALGRAQTSISQRLNTHHRAAWVASGHPECKTKEEKRVGYRSRLAEVEAKCEALEQRIANLEGDLGV